MLSWLVAATLATAAPSCEPADHPAWIEAVRTRGDETSYLCLAADNDSHAPLLAAVEASPDPTAAGHRRIQRALAIHVMQRLDRPVSVDAIRAVNAADRRLLRDAVHARRGRQSPVPEHASVFEKFDWYQPNRRFTNRSLTPLDRDNLQIIDKPPRPEPTRTTDAPALDAVPAPAGDTPRPADTGSTCGCAAGSGPTGLVWLGSLCMVVFRRREG